MNYNKWIIAKEPEKGQCCNSEHKTPVTKDRKYST